MYKYYAISPHAVMPDLREIKNEIGPDELSKLYLLGKAIQNDYIPSTSFANKFIDIDEHESYLMNFFGKQLGSSDDDESWIFPAISVIIPTTLYAHTDKKNCQRRDLTIQVNASLNVNSIPEGLKKEYFEKFECMSDYIPISIIFYQRECITRYSKMNKRIESFRNELMDNSVGRKSIANIMSYVRSDYDYRYHFFGKKAYAENYSKCETMPNTGFKGRILVKTECIDRSVSNLLFILNFLIPY